MSQDAAAVRAFLKRHRDWSWTGPDDEDYVEDVVACMNVFRFACPDGNYPAPSHDANEIGACSECDALRVLEEMEVA